MGILRQLACMRWLALLLPILCCPGSFAGNDSLLVKLHSLPQDASRLPVLEKLFLATVLQQPDSALRFATVYEALARKAGSERNKALAESQLGQAWLLKGRHGTALPHFLEALKRFENLSDTRAVAMIRGNIAEVHSAERHPQKAREQLVMAHAAFVRLNDIMWMAGTSEALGHVYMELGLPDSAYAYFERTAEIMEQVGAADHAVDARMAQAGILAGRGDRSEAIDLYYSALRSAERGGDPQLTCMILNDLGILLSRSGRYREADTLLGKAMRLVSTGHFDRLRADLHRDISDHLQATGDLDSALLHLQLHVLWRDSLFTEENSERIAEMQERFDSARKDADLEHGNALIARQRAQLAIIVAIGVVLVIVAAGLLWAYRQKQRGTRALEESNKTIGAALREKEALLQELHHRVKNNLQTVSSLLRLQARATEPGDARDALDEALARVKSMALVHQDLYRNADIASVDMEAYLNKLASTLLRSHGMAQRVDLRVEADPVALDVDSAVPLGLVVNELITNALKHGFPNERSGEVVVTFRDRGTELFLEVRDNGVGFDHAVRQATNGDGPVSGVSIVRTISARLDAEWSITVEGGTAVRSLMRNFTRAV